MASQIIPSIYYHLILGALLLVGLYLLPNLFLHQTQLENLKQLFNHLYQGCL